MESSALYAAAYPNARAIERAAAVKLLILDVDGVLTDGSLHIGPAGEVFKTFNALDGHGIKLLQQSGVRTAIISARESPSVTRRAAEIGITHIWQGVENKYQAFLELLRQANLSADQVGFIGDDILDLPILLRVKFAVCVANAHAELKTRTHYITQQTGGSGAVREICDFIMQAQNTYATVLAQYLATPSA